VQRSLIPPVEETHGRGEKTEVDERDKPSRRATVILKTCPHQQFTAAFCEDMDSIDVR
jgi:hypothetical protein